MEWKSLLFTLGPLLLPKLISYGRAFYTSVRYSGSTVRPISPSAQRALNVLFITTAIFLVLSFHTFAPENIFITTDARLQTSNDVLFARLRAKREAQGLSGLTGADEVLKDRLQTRDGRLLYLQYGPDSLANCPFCSTDSPRSFLIYALPAMLIPHLVHLVILGITTSEIIAGPDAASWRSHATIAGAILAAAELFVLSRYDAAANTRAVRQADIQHYFWIARTIRYVVLALTDLVFSGLIWLSATRRAFFSLVSPIAERLEATTKLLETQGAKLGALGALRNTVMRDRNLRSKLEHYWTEEGVVMGEVDQEADVVEGLRTAMGRIDIANVELKASEIADEILGGLARPPAPPG